MTAGLVDEATEPVDRDVEPDPPGRSAIVARWSLISAVLVYSAIEVRMIALRVPLGHDEAIYLLRSRAFVDGIDAADLEFWAPYRAPGLPFILSMSTRVFGESVSISRAVVALMGGVVIVLTTLLVDRLAGRSAAVCAPWLVVISSSHTSYASLLLLDVPAMAFVLTAVLLLERSTRGGEVSWSHGALVPLVCFGAAYVRFGVASTLLAGFAAVLLPRAPELLAAGRRARNLFRLAVIGATSAALLAAVLLVPAVTGVELSPLGEQRRRQVDKELSPFASYRDLADIVWPDSSRIGEAYTWWSLAIVVSGIVLTLVAAQRGVGRRAALSGVVAVAVWLIVINLSLAQMFANYVGLGVPFIVLLAAPGWGWVLDKWRTRDQSAAARRGGWLVAAGAVAVAVWAAAGEAYEQVSNQEGMEVYRATGSELDRVSVDGRCGVVASYVQVAWYGDCHLVPYTIVGDPEEVGLYRTEISATSFPDGTVDPDEVYALVVDRGKRQPEPDALTVLLNGGEVVAAVDHRTRPTEIWRVPDTQG